MHDYAIVVYNIFQMEMCIKNINIFGPKLERNMSNFIPLEVVNRGSETQLQVGEKFNYLM